MTPFLMPIKTPDMTLRTGTEWPFVAAFTIAAGGLLWASTTAVLRATIL